MSLYYVLDQLGKKMGLNPSDSTQRAILLDKVRTAAKELYDTSDMAGSLEEELFKVNGNQTIAFPAYMGDIRAMREGFDRTAIKLSQMRPRYNQFNWEDGWRNWRQKGLHALQTSLRNQSQLTLTVQEVENPPVTVYVSGPIVGASMASEAVVMSQTSVQTVNAYLDIAALTKQCTNSWDISINDADGNQISYIPCNQIRALFQIMDISDAPWFIPNTNALFGWVEVLYKKALIWLTNDSDEFPAPGYDDVIVYKCLQSYYEDQNNPQAAIAYYQKAMTVLAQIHENANRGTDDVASLCEHGHDRMNHRTGFGRDWRFAYRITGR
jgi:tetratricopeptide (TPR) repeat protein